MEWVIDALQPTHKFGGHSSLLSSTTKIWGLRGRMGNAGGKELSEDTYILTSHKAYNNKACDAKLQILLSVISAIIIAFLVSLYAWESCLAWIACFRRKILSFFVIIFFYHLFPSHILNRYINFSMKNDEKYNPNTTFNCCSLEWFHVKLHYHLC